MNLKDWKKFSDAVDKENQRILSDWQLKEKELDKKWEEGLTGLRQFHSIRPANALALSQRTGKTEVNFWEWKCGKLKI